MLLFYLRLPSLPFRLSCALLMELICETIPFRLESVMGLVYDMSTMQSLTARSTE